MRLSDARPFRQEIRSTLWLPLYLLLFFLLEHLPDRSYFSTQSAIDTLIPFCEWFIIPYMLWFPLLIGLGIRLLLKAPPAYRRYMAYLGITFLMSAAIWLFLPSQQDLRPAVMPRNNALTTLVSLLYQIDTNTNVFPSVHVLGALGAVYAAKDAFPKQRAVRAFIYVLSALICLSTVLLKQHSLLDALGGFSFGFLAALPIYYRSQSMRLCHE